MNKVPPSRQIKCKQTLGQRIAANRILYGTPKAQDERAALTDRGKGNFGEQVHQEYNAKEVGGRLNPSFVEFLMGYPQGWTKIEATESKASETQSYHKLQEK